MPVYENCHFVSFESTELKMCGEMWGDVGLSRQSIPKPPNTAICPQPYAFSKYSRYAFNCLDDQPRQR
jgi:hypothetical protein